MSKKYLQIQIPTPCSEDFSKMTSVEKGNFCSSCEKVVIDFSKMSDQEIANFYKKSGGKLCGRFHHSQLNRDIRLTPPKVNSIFGKTAGLILTGVLSAGVTNVAAESLKFEAPTEIIQIENEEEENTENHEGNDQFKSIKFLLVGPGYYQHSDVNKPLHRIQVIHLATRITGDSDSLGIVELKIPNTYFENDDLSFAIGNNSYKYKNICVSKNDFKESNILKVILEAEYRFVFMGDISFTESSLPQSGTFENIGPVNDFEKTTQIEENRKEEDSNIDELNIFEKPSLFPPIGVAIKKIYPNPFIDRINIEISTEKEGNIQINLLDISGRIVFQKLEQTKRGVQQFQIEVGNLSLSGNMYILQTQDESGNTQSQQLMRFTNHGFTMR